MASLTLTGPRDDLVEQLEDFIDQVRDTDNEEPSTAFMPKDTMGSAFYLEYVPTADDASDGDNDRLLYELT